MKTEEEIRDKLLEYRSKSNTDDAAYLYAVEALTWVLE